MAIKHFLLTYNLRRGLLEHIDQFGEDTRAATTAYADLEEKFRARDDHNDYEIVLIGADSLETVQVTHSRYFNGGLRVPDFSELENA